MINHVDRVIQSMIGLLNGQPDYMPQVLRDSILREILESPEYDQEHNAQIELFFKKIESRFLYPHLGAPLPEVEKQRTVHRVHEYLLGHGIKTEPDEVWITTDRNTITLKIAERITDVVAEMMKFEQHPTLYLRVITAVLKRKFAKELKLKVEESQ